MKFVVGIDVAKDKFDCLWLKNPDTLKIKSKVLANNPKGFEDLRLWLQKHITPDLADIQVIMEATSVYHEPLAYALHGMGVMVSVINPAFVRDFAKGLGVRHKTDKKDSLVLARYGVAIQPPAWQPEPTAVRELKALLARLAALEMDLQRELNRLEKTRISPVSARVLQSIESMVAHLRREKQQLETEVDDHIDRHPDLKKDRNILQSIPAIGNVLSQRNAGAAAQPGF